MSVMHVYKLLDAVTAVFTGDIFTDKGAGKLQVIITGVATVAIEVSLDGVTWSQIPPAFTASGIYVMSGDGWKYIRAKTTAWTSGMVTVLLGV
ncbi:MAG: hypothetical protein OEW11_09595 [Nitrospirota bacterium]|nr:hypothetical protein [Nitrospirota bacterium]